MTDVEIAELRRLADHALKMSIDSFMVPARNVKTILDRLASAETALHWSVNVIERLVDCEADPKETRDCDAAARAHFAKWENPDAE